MPKRTDIKKILLIGSGPIIISQACEFDYSGSQACKALKEEGYEIVLVNSNPATIMTDPGLADKTYIEPVTWEFLEKIIEKERPDALLPTLGGQTGLNVAIQLHDNGVLEKYKVKMIGAQPDVIKKAEDRQLFKEAMEKIGLGLPKSGLAYNMDDARKVAKEIGFPVIIRPSFTLGGTGGATAYNSEEFEALARRGIELSMINEILIEESVIGWKEYELEVMRDKKDNVVIICPIENFDPMGIHTGDSITVAPAQTLTDKEYQIMRDAAIAVIREIGVETGGSNIQFAINPENGKMVVIEMNPRVSRSSALASKATGFPIAKIAAKLAVGYTLDEIPNDITKKTPASFEPTIDYCVVKIPRWAFEKFPGADPTLTIQMKSVGEVMAIGRTFKEALQKGLRGLEIGRSGLGLGRKDIPLDKITDAELKEKLTIPNADRLFYIRYAMLKSMPIDEIYNITKIDKWFLENIKEILEAEARIKKAGSIEKMSKEFMLEVKQLGFSDRQLAAALGSQEVAVREIRKSHGIEPVYKLVDTCAAEFEAYTPYYYSTYETPYLGASSGGLGTPSDIASSVAGFRGSEDETRKSDKKKIMILGGGPNRIGQGIEFDYCCVHASFALKELGFETIMVNCNPETVSTDYDTSDKLYFEPITFEDVMNIVDKEHPDGVIVQFGGQTPLNIALQLEKAGVKIIGTSPDAIDIAEDRKRFSEMVEKLKFKQPPNGIAYEIAPAQKIAAKLGFPVLVRPSYVLGGRAMEIVYDEQAIEYYMTHAVQASPERPVLIDKFIEDAIEVDVDMIADGETFVIGAIMEHIEEAGVHSGDAAMVLPPHTLSREIKEEISRISYALARELNVVGLMNVQFAVRGREVYILEVNPRASRTIPFVSKAIGVPLAKLAAKIMAGKTLKELEFTKEIVPPYISVKESVLPFVKFPGIDIILGPEMKSTGEVMGIDVDFGKAFSRAETAASTNLPVSGTVFLSVNDKTKKGVVPVAAKLSRMGFDLVATEGTARELAKNNIKVTALKKIAEGSPNILDYMKEGKVKLVINTPSGKSARTDEVKIRSMAVLHGVSCITTIPGAIASANGIEAQINHKLGVTPLQEWHKHVAKQS